MSAMNTIKASMNGESASSEPVSGLRSGAREGSVNKPKMIKPTRTAQNVYFNPRPSSAEMDAPCTASSSPAGVYFPILGSMNLSVSKETTIVIIMTEAIPNQKFDISPME